MCRGSRGKAVPKEGRPEHQLRREDPPRRDERGCDQEFINTIVVGFTGGGSSNNAKKKHLRAVNQVNTISFQPRMPHITFTDEDFKGVDPSQNDSMVISVDIEKFTIMKTLVDQGNLVNILYWKMLKQMRIAEEEMKSDDDHVVGFSGESGHPRAGPSKSNT